MPPELRLGVARVLRSMGSSMCKEADMSNQAGVFRAMKSSIRDNRTELPP